MSAVYFEVPFDPELREGMSVSELLQIFAEPEDAVFVFNGRGDWGKTMDVGR